MMIPYAISTLPGRVCGFLESDTMPVLHDPTLIAHVLLDRVDRWPEPPTPTAELWVANGVLYWDDPAMLAEARTQAWAAVKKERDTAEAVPFEFEGGMYDPSKENISGAALAALLAQLAGQEIADEWTLADNTRKTLSGPQIIALGLALTQRVKEIHARGRQLRDLIDNAATPAEAYGYTWNSLDA